MSQLPAVFRTAEITALCYEFNEDEAFKQSAVSGAPTRDHDEFDEKHYAFLTPHTRIFKRWLSELIGGLPLDVRGCLMGCDCKHIGCRHFTFLQNKVDDCQRAFGQSLFLTSNLINAFDAPIWTPGPQDSIEVTRQRLFEVYESLRATAPNHIIVEKLISGAQKRFTTHRAAMELWDSFKCHVASLQSQRVGTHALFGGDVAGPIIARLDMQARINLRRTCTHFAQLADLSNALPHLRIRSTQKFPHVRMNATNYLDTRTTNHVFVDFCTLEEEHVGSGAGIGMADGPLVAPPPGSSPATIDRYNKFVAARKRKQGPSASEGRRINIVDYNDYFHYTPELRISLVYADTHASVPDGLAPSAKLFQNQFHFHAEEPKNPNRTKVVYVGANTRFKIKALSSRHSGRAFKLRVAARPLTKQGKYLELEIFSDAFITVSNLQRLSARV